MLQIVSRYVVTEGESPPPILHIGDKLESAWSGISSTRQYEGDLEFPTTHQYIQAGNWSIEPTMIFARDRVRAMLRAAEEEEKEMKMRLMVFPMEVREMLEQEAQEWASTEMEELLKDPPEDEEEDDDECIGAEIIGPAGSCW